MATSTEGKTEVAAGLNEEPVTTLLGDDLSQLTPVEPEELTEGDPSASTEGLEAGGVKDCGDEEGQCRCIPRPAVSRVIGTDGNARVTIVLGPYERAVHLGTTIGFIDSASEKDIVDITIVSSVSGEAGTMAQRSLLSAIDRCKGHVITRAGALTTLGDVAIWLSGDERRMSSIGSVFVRQPVAGYMGDTADYELRLQNYREAIKEYSDFVVGCGMFTQEEMNDMYEHRAMIALYGDKLRQRVANLKPIE